MEYRDFQINVTAPLTGVPQWYADIPLQQEGQWVELTLSHTLDAVKQPVLNGKDAAIAALLPWISASVDPVRGDLLIVAAGGHADGWSNAAYGFRYMANTPGWYCLSEQSPQSVINAYVEPANGTIACYPDGRMCSVHQWNRPVYANGKVWFTAQDSYPGSGNGFVWGVWSFDPTTPGVPSGPGGSPLPWANGAPVTTPGETRGPWKYWGRMSTYPSDGGGPACYDPTSGLIWTFGAEYGGQRFFTVNPQSSTLTYTPYTTSYEPRVLKGAWVVPTPIGLVASERTGVNRVQILNRTTKTWSAQVTTGANNWNPSGVFGTPLGVFPEGWGAVYDPQANAIYAYDIQQLGAKIRKLNLSTWVWTEYTPSGGATPVRSAGTVGDGHGSYGKFNIVKVGSPGGVDRYALLNVCHTTKVYAMKLPAAGL